MTSELPPDLSRELRRSGYFPQTALACVRRAVGRDELRAYLVHPETTFEGTEVRRHLTVLCLTARRFIVVHLDDSSVTAGVAGQVGVVHERVALDALRTVGMNQVFDTRGTAVIEQESEVTLELSWGGRRRIDLERAWCDDPECTADHGYTGSSADLDLSLRVSAAADGEAAVGAALAFYDELVDAIDDLR